MRLGDNLTEIMEHEEVSVIDDTFSARKLKSI